MPARKAEQILEKYFSQIEFTGADFFEGEGPTFPACLRIEFPTQMLFDYARLRNITPNQISETKNIDRILRNFWKETGLAAKLTKHKDAKKIPSGATESSIDMLDYLQGEEIIIEPYHNLFNLNKERIQIEIYDRPNHE